MFIKILNKAAYTGKTDKLKYRNAYVKGEKIYNRELELVSPVAYFRFDFYESDNSHFAVAISVGEFDPLTSISVYLRMELEQGYIRSRMNN